MNNQITSFICSVSIGIDTTFLAKLMTESGYSPDNDFEYDQMEGTPFFQHVRDYVSGLDYINHNGCLIPLGSGFYTGAGSAIVLFESIRIKEHVIKSKYPKRLLAFHESINLYFITLGLKCRQIDFFHFQDDKDGKKGEYYEKRRIGCFPYFDFISDVLKLHQTIQDPYETPKRAKAEKEVFSDKKYAGWRLLERREFDVFDVTNYAYLDESPLKDFRFESDFGVVKLSFQPEMGEINTDLLGKG